MKQIHRIYELTSLVETTVVVLTEITGRNNKQYGWVYVMDGIYTDSTDPIIRPLQNNRFVGEELQHFDIRDITDDILSDLVEFRFITDISVMKLLARSFPEIL